MRRACRAGIVGMLLVAGGCSFVPRYARPAAPVPAAFPSGGAYPPPVDATLPSVGYRDIFRDPRLRTIIAEALANNRDLRVAAANIAVARAQYRIQRAEQLPEVDLGGTYTRSDSGTGRTSAGGSPVTGGGRDNLSVTGGITAFEIDLFGRVRALSAAAQARYFSTEAAASATRLTLVGDIATTWLTYASDQSLLRIARETAASARNSVSLTQARLDGGVAPRTDLAEAEIIEQTARSDLADQTTLVAQDLNALQLLVGAPVAPELLPVSIEEAAPTVAELRAGLSSDVLLRRPDVVEAEYTLRAANADIGAARAALFPRISLTSVGGLASNVLSRLFTGGAFNYSAGPSVSYPIFRAGAGRAGVVEARAQRDAALASYEKAIQTAFREVSDALARRGTIDARLAAQRALTAASGDNYRLSNARYQGGIDTFLQSLDAQRSFYNAQRTLAQTRLIQGTNLVTLYRTLGGDATLDVTDHGPAPAGTTRP